MQLSDALLTLAQLAKNIDRYHQQKFNAVFFKQAKNIQEVKRCETKHTPG